MKLVSYMSCGPIEFEATICDVISKMGAPKERHTNFQQENEFQYDEVIVRSDAETELVREFTLLPRVEGEFSLNEVCLNWREDFLDILCGSDREILLREVSAYIAGALPNHLAAIRVQQQKFVYGIFNRKCEAKLELVERALREARDENRQSAPLCGSSRANRTFA